MKRFHQFSYEYLESTIKSLFDSGFEFTNCIGYYQSKSTKSLSKKMVVLRVDVDISMKKIFNLLKIFENFNIRASFFIRLHSNEYNPFSFENYLILKKILDKGHEIGLHSEVIDQSMIWNEDPYDCLKTDLSSLQQNLGVKIEGVASHGGLTGLNNLDFWGNYTAKEVGVKYEAYDRSPSFGLFWNSLYVSDSEWLNWKYYLDGVKLESMQSSFIDYASLNNKIIYLLIHPETFYQNHPYE